MTRMWRLIALGVLLLGIAGILRLYRVGFVWRNGLSLETTVVLFVGLIAFLAVMIQVEAERNARTEETEGQNKAVTRAILFEIDSIFPSMIRETGKALEDTPNREFVVKPHSLWFPVYEGNSGNLGRLPADRVQEIVQVYGGLRRYLVTLEQYYSAVINLHAAHDERGVDWQKLALGYRTELVSATPILTLMIYNASKYLCEYAGVKFESPTVAVAAEDVDLLIKKVGQTASSATKQRELPNAQTH